jgi:ribulose-5-phosphate 4-epimerase/fuculose-1-phosphate aldolase
MTITIERGNLTIEDGWESSDDGQLYAAFYDVPRGLVAIGFSPENAAHNLERLDKQVQTEIIARKQRRESAVRTATNEVIDRHES